MTVRRLTAAILSACISVLSLGAAVDITGKWTASFGTPIGQMNYTYDFVLKDGQLTGKIHSSTFGEADVLEGKVDGDKVTFVELMDGSIRVEYTGRIVSVDENRLFAQGRRLRDRGADRQAHEAMTGRHA